LSYGPLSDIHYMELSSAAHPLFLPGF